MTSEPWGGAAGPVGLRGLVLAVSMLLAGCAMQGPTVSLAAGTSPGAFIPGALQASAVQFVGPQGRASHPTTTPRLTGGPRGATLVFTPDMLKPGSSTPFVSTDNLAVAVRVEGVRPVTPASEVFAAMRLGSEHRAFYLPRGIGPLIDPTRIAFAAQTAGVEIGARRRLALDRRGLSLVLGVAAGADLRRTRTHIRSALIDMTNRHSDRPTHLRISAGLGWQPEGARLRWDWTTDVTATDDGQRLLGTALRLTRVAPQPPP